MNYYTSKLMHTNYKYGACGRAVGSEALLQFPLNSIELLIRNSMTNIGQHQNGCEWRA